MKILKTDYKPIHLTYSYDAFDDFVGPETMKVHYTKHHMGYCQKLSDALRDSKRFGTSPTELLCSLDSLPAKIQKSVRNNAGGIVNHNLFFSILNPDSIERHDDLNNKICEDFGSFSKFKNKFIELSLDHFGSGWTFLVLNEDFKLDIYTLDNQDSPYINSEDVPILNLDLWEHSYYLKYKNDRESYVRNFFKYINWNRVLDNLAVLCY